MKGFGSGSSRANDLEVALAGGRRVVTAHEFVVQTLQ